MSALPRIRRRSVDRGDSSEGAGVRRRGARRAASIYTARPACPMSQLRMEPAPPHRLERWLCHPRFFRAVLLLALALAAFTVIVGFYSDDYLLLCYLAELIPGSPPWYDLYNFVSG